MPQVNRKSTVSRRSQILQTIDEIGEVFVDQLSHAFDVSEVTIRNDLDRLEQKGLLVRARGGAMKNQGRVGVDFGISEKDKINIAQKTKIGIEASKLVSNGEIILIDSGSTTAVMARHLGDFDDLTVITNALNISNILINKENLNLVIPGGFIRKNSQSLVGPIAEKSLKNMHVDKVFLGVDSIDSRHGLYTPNIEEAHLNEIMIEIANEVIILTDSSKFNRKSFAFIGGFDKITKIITDDALPEDEKSRLIDMSVEVIIT